jgi:NAD(P)-dependent dehydrogenase (short-subunit alcohol dehydrogenase family)
MSIHYVISGAGRGIGLELTRQALQAGNRVSALVRHPEKATQLQSLKHDFADKLQVFSVDVTEDSAVKSFSKQIEKTAVDVLINNAGAYLDTDSDFETLDLAKVMDTFAINSVAPMRLARALLPELKKSKHPKLINITSLMGSIADNEGGGSYAYRMSKTALNMFVKTFSRDFPEITALVIHPGWVKTDMGGQAAPTSVEESAKGIHAVISSTPHSKSGHFFDFEGDELPW